MSRPEWGFESEASTFRIQLSFVGEQIAVVRVGGYARLQDVERSIAMTRPVIDSVVPALSSYVYIADYSDLGGVSYRARQYFSEMLSQRSQIESVILCGLGVRMALTVKLGLRRVRVGFPIIIRRDYPEAVALAAKRLGLELAPPATSSLGQPVPAGTEVMSDPSWEVEVEGFYVKFEVVDGRILHSLAKGHLGTDHVDQISALRARVLERCGDRRFHFVVAGVGGFAATSAAGRRAYVDSLAEWHAQHPVDAFIFYGANRFLRTAVSLARPFLPFKILIARDFSQALSLTRDDAPARGIRGLGRFFRWTTALTRRRRREASQHHDELLRYLGSIHWDREGISDELPVDESHPLADVFEAIQLIKEEIDGLLAEQGRDREAIERGQRQLGALVEHLPEGVALLDESESIVVVNPLAAELLQLITDAGVGDRIEALGGEPLDSFDSIDSEIGTAVRDLVVKGSPERVLEISRRPIGPAGSVLVLRDVTHERSARRQLEQQERLAAVGKLASGIAHDFNNILQAIRLSADGIVQQSHEPGARAAAEVVVEQSERGARLIQQILDFGRRTVSRQQPADLSQLLSEMVGMLGRTIPETISITLFADGGPYVVSADTSQIQQLITNLGLNARDAMPSGGTLQLALGRQRVMPDRPPPVAGMEPGEWVELTVSDTGVGIPSELLPHIFEPFFSTKGPKGGSGLGLAQVYGIVKQHRAFIDCSSEPGRGTTFRIFFPALRSAEVPLEEEWGREEFRRLSELSAPGSISATVLLAEDDATLRRLISSTLEARGHRVLPADNGQDALRLYEAAGEPVTLVISDVVMPGLGGVELCRLLRERSPELAVLLMSGYPLGSEVEELGSVAWLGKPFSADQLREAVDLLLARTAALGEGPVD